MGHYDETSTISVSEVLRDCKTSVFLISSGGRCGAPRTSARCSNPYSSTRLAAASSYGNAPIRTTGFP